MSDYNDRTDLRCAKSKKEKKVMLGWRCSYQL